MEAGAAGECRASILNLYDCDPRQALMVLVTLDETANSNGSLQIYQASMSAGKDDSVLSVTKLSKQQVLGAIVAFPLLLVSLNK